MSKPPEKLLPKLLFIGHLPPPVHGVTLINSYIVKSEIIRAHFNIESVGLSFGRSLDELARFSFKKVLKAVGYLAEIGWKVLKRRPDIVYFTLVPTGFAFYRDATYVCLLKAFRVKIVLHLHGKGVAEAARQSKGRSALYRWVFKNTSIICLSENVATDVAAVYEGKPYIVPNGIEVQTPWVRPSGESKKEAVQILYLSNYIRQKGILVLMEALGILRARGYDFHARFVGAPFDLTVANLEEEVRRHQLVGFADIVGPRGGAEKWQEYKNADIFVFPTCFEAFGLVTLEAMQYSLPVIATFEGSLPEIIVDNETGLLVEKNNPRMLAEKIAVLIENAPLRSTMGKSGYQRFRERYTLEQFERNMNTTLRAILDDGNRKALTPEGSQRKLSLQDQHTG